MVVVREIKVMAGKKKGELRMVAKKIVVGLESLILCMLQRTNSE